MSALVRSTLRGSTFASLYRLWTACLIEVMIRWLILRDIRAMFVGPHRKKSLYKVARLSLVMVVLCYFLVRQTP